MYEKFILDVNELAMCDPRDHLVDKHLLTLLEYNTRPTLKPSIAPLKRLPKNVNNDSSLKFLTHYLLYDTP